MSLLLPMLTFVAVFAAVLVWNRRSQKTMQRLERHQMVVTAGAVPVQLQHIPLLGENGRISSAGQLAQRLTREEVRTKSGKLLREAGNPQSLSSYLLTRLVCTFVMMPAWAYLVLGRFGMSFFGILMAVVGGFTLFQLPVVRVKRKARKRAKAVELAMPDALDLLVVCAEGGLSLDGAMQQVAERTEGLLATEFRRLLHEVGGGMSRRDALLSLAERNQSENLKIFCSTIAQADKMGMSVATTLRTLAVTMRTRRRQAAETQARKAPIKMMPCLVMFMIPSLFIVVLGPAVLSLIQFMGDI